MDGFDKDLTDEITRAVGPDVWMFVAMIAATFAVAGLVLLGLCVHVYPLIAALALPRNRPMRVSESMRWLVKQFELGGQHRDTHIRLGAREVRLKCV